MTGMGSRRLVTGILPLVGGAIGVLGGAWTFVEGLQAAIGPAARLWSLGFTLLFSGSADWASVGDGWVEALAWFAGSLALFCVGWGAIIAGMNALTQPPAPDGVDADS
jgi:hypothetical protein